jgi:hypothetical protein
MEFHRNFIKKNRHGTLFLDTLAIAFQAGFIMDSSPMARNSNGKTAQAVPPDADFDIYQVGSALTRLIQALPRPVDNVLVMGPVLPVKDAALPGTELVEHTLNASRFSRGIRLPFQENEFSCTVVFDTLETLSHDNHKALIEQLACATREYMIVISPFDSPVVRSARRSVGELCRDLQGAGEHDTTAELADLNSTSDLLAGLFGERPQVFPLGSVRSWSLLHMLKRAIPEMDQGRIFYRNLIQLYNQRLSLCDWESPNYRNVVLCNRTSMSPEASEKIRTLFSCNAHTAEVRIMFDLLRIGMDALTQSPQPRPAAGPLHDMKQRLDDLERKNRIQLRQIEKLTAQLEGTKISGNTKSRHGLLGKLFSQ